MIAGVYLGSPPACEAGVRAKKLDTLTTVARQYSSPIVDALNHSLDRKVLDARVRQAADASGARVTLLGLTRGTQGLQTYVASDSTAQREIGDLQFDVALEAARTRRVARGTEAGNIGRVAEAALPLWLTAPGKQEARRLLRRRLLGAAGGRRRHRLAHPRARPRRRRRSRCSARCWPATCWRGRSAAASGAWSTPPAASPRATSARASSRAPATSSASSRARWTRCSASSPSSRPRGGASSPPPRTSCARRSSRSAASWSCSRTRSSTRRRAAAFLHQLRQQVDRLGKLATELLDLSRLEAGSLELRPEPTDIGDLAKTVAAEFTPALAAHESHLELRLTGGQVEALCDPERVAQIMRILIDNALNHTPPAPTSSSPRRAATGARACR